MTEVATIDLTDELNELLFFSGEVASAIRMYSCYARSENEPFSPQDSKDVLVLSDTLHYFGSVASNAIKAKKSGDYSALVASCEKVIGIFTQYKNKVDLNNSKFNLAATFANETNAALCDYDIAIGALNKILGKIKTNEGS